MTKPKLSIPKTMFLRPKPIKVVTKKALHQIADSIHDPKTGHYLNLCTGTLQNGPDPVCETRTMHCGLGELYFVVTGHQPEEDYVDENDVIDEVVKRSTLSDYEKIFEKESKKARKAIEKLDLPADLTYSLLDKIDDHCFENVQETEFREILDGIPNINDDGNENTSGFKSRAKRVAECIRKAADLLPR